MARATVFERRLARMKQLVESMEGPMGVKEVEDIERYVQEKDFVWTPCFKPAKDDGSKKGWVRLLRIAGPNEPPLDTTIKNDETGEEKQETEGKIPKEGNYIINYVTRPQDTGWDVDPETFEKTYSPTETKGIFKPKGALRLSTMVDESINFLPPNWGGATASVDAGGYLIMDPYNPRDIYPIGKTQYETMYEEAKSLNDEQLNILKQLGIKIKF